MSALDLLKVPVPTKGRAPGSQQIYSKLMVRQMLQVKAQRYKDQEDAERSWSNVVDGTSLSVLKRRIAEVKAKERCRRSSSCDIVGWNYSSSSCPNQLRKRHKYEASEVWWEMVLLVLGSISFTVFSGTVLLCFVSLLIHLLS